MRGVAFVLVVAACGNTSEPAQGQHEPCDGTRLLAPTEPEFPFDPSLPPPLPAIPAEEAHAILLPLVKPGETLGQEVVRPLVEPGHLLVTGVASTETSARLIAAYEDGMPTLVDEAEHLEAITAYFRHGRMTASLHRSLKEGRCVKVSILTYVMGPSEVEIVETSRTIVDWVELHGATDVYAGTHIPYSQRRSRLPCYARPPSTTTRMSP